MSKKILVDADVLIELFLNRSKFRECFNKFAEIRADQQYELYTTSKCLKRISDECSETRSNQVRDDVISQKNIIFIHKDITDKACNSSLVDFDSAEELICATESNLDAILTLTPQNFDGADLEIISLQALTGKYPKTGLRKHLTKVIFGSLVFLGIGISIGIFRYYQDSRIFKKHIPYQDMEKECQNQNFYNQEFRHRYQKWDNVDKSYFEKIYLEKDDSLKEVIPAHRWRCVYRFKVRSTTGGSAIETLGLELKDYCERTYKGYEGRIDARPLYYDNPDSISCVLTQ